MGALRSISRSAHPVQWAERKKTRTLRRLHQQASRAAKSGDLGRMQRLAALLKRHEPMLYEKILGEAKDLDGMIQRGKGGLSEKGAPKAEGKREIKG